VRIPLLAIAVLMFAPVVASAADGATGAPGSPALAEIDGYMTKARDALDTNHLAEAIRSYVSVLALAEESPSTATRLKAAEAEAALARIGTRLTLEPSSEWIDAKGSQIAGSTWVLGKGSGPFPSVLLFESFGTGKSPVADAPIFFQFLKNSGSLVAIVTTDAYGKANTTVAGLASPGEEATVRAYPVFRSRGRDYAFPGVFRDFSYLPPASSAMVVVLESSELGASDNPRTVDAIVDALRPLGLALVPQNGKLAPERFRQAFGGDVGALASLGVGEASPYAALALVEVAPARQMEMNGKKYNIFTAQATATFRLVRSDGSIVLSLPLDSIKGQGGTAEASIADAFKRARDELGPALKNRRAELEKALRTE